MSSARKIIIAVDFGTTFSGVAWAQTRNPDVQNPIIQWPDTSSEGLEGITSDKVPTEIQYQENNDDDDDDDNLNFKWGFQITESSLRHKWFKLGLDPFQRRGMSNLARDHPDPTAAPPGYNLATETLVTDYFTALRQHAEQILHHKIPQSALQSTKIEYVITVPAVWSDAAQAKTRFCAEHAGMGLGSALQVISEPEAAATYALKELDPHDIEVGDTFVVCDAGGGTVDLISYTVKSLSPILEITEAAPGSGSLCGSSFINRKFEEFLKDKLTSDPNWGDDILEEATRFFELSVKRRFYGNVREEFRIPVPGIYNNANLGVNRGRFHMTGAHVKDMFDPIIHEVITLIEEQMTSTKKKVKAILLVGGFGQSAYLRDRIREAVGSTEVLQSPNGWTAIVRGALMKGLASATPLYQSIKVSGRSARKHYGISSRKQYNETYHDQARRFWSPYHSHHRIGTMDWFIKKGSTVEEKAFRVHYFQDRLVSAGRPGIVICSIYTSSSDKAPMYKDEDATIGSVSKLVDVKADLSRVPAQNFRKTQGADYLQYYRIEYEVEITYYSGYTKYELIHNNINYGPVIAEYV